jgi:Flp pilus assembly protein TadG
MKNIRKKSQRGSTMVEFSLAGIPMIFVLISAVQMALGMWQYETLAYAVKTGAQAVVSKGQGCTTGGNSCGTTVGVIATAISRAAIGISPDDLNVTLVTASGAITSCNPIRTCLSSSTAWPPSTNNDNLVGQTITVTGNFTLTSAMAVFYPGSTPVSINAAKLSATATQPLMF